MQRRQFLITTAVAGSAVLLGACGRATETSVAAGSGKWNLTEAQWRKRLTPAQYHILRQNGTEPAFSSPLNANTKPGIYHCAGCDLPLYSSTTKFHSGTGWPSFYKPLPNAIATRADHGLFTPRTEVHCRRCGGHLGHVFKDGPPPTGLRYCMDGLALKFHAGETPDGVSVRVM